MKKSSITSTFFLIGVILAFTQLASCRAAGEQWVNVRWVDDGDTIILADGRRVRYIGINTPEIRHEDQSPEPFGYQAQAFNKKLVYKQKVRLEFDRQMHDRYQRVLAYIFLPDGTFVNAKLVAEGYAFLLPFRSNRRYASVLLKLQREAMAAGKGIWHHWQETPAAYIGNRRSKRFHRASCPFAAKIKPKNRVHFTKKWDAFWAGYAPAKKCIPKYWSYANSD